jgi:type IV pilus assembly protein PilB
MGIQPFLIPASFNIVIAQRLLRRLCPHCKKEVGVSEVDKETLLNIKNSLAATPKDELL